LPQQSSSFSKAPTYIDALSPGGVLYQRSPDRAIQELRRLQEREMRKVRQIETMSPGMGVGYWNGNPVLSKVGSLEMTDDNGVNVYALNGQPIAYGTRGAENTYSLSQTRPDQAGAKTPAPAQAVQAADQSAGANKIERSRGHYERPQQTVLGLPYGYDINKLPGGPDKAEFRAEHPSAPVPRALEERPRETVLGVENAPAQSTNVHPQFRKAPWVGERIAQDVAAAADVPKNLLRQMIAFPSATIANPVAAAAATVAYPWRRLASKVAPSLVAPPRHPLETGENVERGIYDYITRPNEPRAELTTRALEKINKIPPLQLANKPSEALERIKSELADKGYPNAGRAVRMSGNIALLGVAGKGGKKAGLPERLAREKPVPTGQTIFDTGEGKGKTMGPRQGTDAGREGPTVTSTKPRLGPDTIVESNSSELNGLRYSEAVTRLYDSALNPKDNSLKRISLGRVSEENARRVKEAAKKEGVDIDLSGYTRDMDNYSIRHIHGKHGDSVVEKKRGQIAVTKEDIARIPEIVETADVVEYVGKTKVGRDAVLYKKRINGTIYYVEEARTKRGTVCPTSLHIVKAATS
jgi:hypothetical protein